MKKIVLVKVSGAYCNYLRNFDNKISYNKGSKELRPFIGILFTMGECEYFAPLSSPKEKHKTMKNTLDFIKIDNGNCGAVNFNNMIPVTKGEYKIIDVNKKRISIEENRYQILLQKQLYWVNQNANEICDKAFKLYIKYINNTLPKNIKLRCCNFKLLEIKSKEYNKTLEKVI